MLSSARRRTNGFVVIPEFRAGRTGGTYVRMILTMLHECDYPDTIACDIYLIIFLFLEFSPAFRKIPIFPFPTLFLDNITLQLALRCCFRIGCQA